MSIIYSFNNFSSRSYAQLSEKDFTITTKQDTVYHVTVLISMEM